MKTLKEKSTHGNQEAVYWWTILDIQEKKKKKRNSKCGKDKKKCPVSMCTYDSLYIRQNEISQIHTVTLNYNDSMNQPVWRKRRFPAIKES